MTTSQPPGWMRSVLLAAGVYNLLWGAWGILLPGSLWNWMAVPPPNYPELWQCIGMIVGVYGIGYAIAAFDPVRHWPIILVGLLGKILGPLGMVHAVWTGALPGKFALVCLSNDLLWWLPFTLILLHVWRTGRWR